MGSERERPEHNQGEKWRLLDKEKIAILHIIFRMSNRKEAGAIGREQVWDT